MSSNDLISKIVVTLFSYSYSTSLVLLMSFLSARDSNFKELLRAIICF